MIRGKIIKGIAGFYYVHVPQMGIYECKARGVFRNQSIKPLIGDNVLIEPLANEDMKGNILEVDDRTNELLRPSVANIGQVMIVFSVKHPKPNLNLLDRFLIMIEKEGLMASICLNKEDTLDETDPTDIKTLYADIGYQVYMTSALFKTGIIELEAALKDTTTVFAGPSGVGKSSLLNLIQSQVALETGGLSKKVERGKHTTRHAEIICFQENSYVVDTPGFSSIDLSDMEPATLKAYFREFEAYEGNCRFNGCNHLNEPDCAIKKAVEAGQIASSRYEHYSAIFEELKNIRRW